MRVVIRQYLPLFAALALAGASDGLPIGQPLPLLSGENLSGKPLALPAASAGSAGIVIFSFSKSAGADAQLWGERLAREHVPNRVVSVFRVIVLESVPKLFRGMAMGGIKNGIPQALHDKTILLFRDEEAWKKRLGVSNDKNSSVVLLDAEGRVRWICSAALNEARFSELRKELAPQLARFVVIN